MDRIEAMRSLVQVVELGSFTRAAAALGRHKATVSDQVAALEQALGVVLLTRTTRTVVPTTEGLDYARKAALILAQLDEADAALRTTVRHPQGVLRVEMPTPIGHVLVVPEVHHFLTRYPRVSLELNCNDRRSDLIQDGVDCVLRAGELPDSSLVCRPLGRLEFALYASPAYLARQGVPKDPEDLSRHQFIGYRNAADQRPQAVQLSQGPRTVTVNASMRLVVSDAVSVVRAAVAGLGVVHATSFAVSRHLRAGALVPVLPEWQGRRVPLSLLATRGRFRTARVQVFMDWLQELLQRSEPRVLAPSLGRNL